MSTMHQWLAIESAWWWPRVGDHLWQATLFGLFVCAASLALRRGPARLRHALWIMASLKLLVPAAFLFLVAQQAGAKLPESLGTIPAAQESRIFHSASEPVSVLSNNYQVPVYSSQSHTHNELYCALTTIWVAGVLSLTFLWWIRRRKFLHALKAAQPLSQGREWLAFNRASALLGSTRKIELVLSHQKVEPAVGRIWRPVVILPHSISEHLNDRELEAILLHELVHVQRHDNLIGTLQMVVLALFWFHPLVWIISRRLISERELACDEKVLAVCGTPEAYASSILKVVRFSFGWKTAGVSGAGNGSNLRRRIKNIMASNNTRRPVRGMHLLAGTLIVLGVTPTALMGANRRARTMAAAEDPMGTIAPEPNVAMQTVVKPARPAEPSQPTQPAPPPPPPAQPGQPVQSTAPIEPPQPPQPGQPTNVAPLSPPTPSLPASPASDSTAPSPAAPASPPAAPGTPGPETDRKQRRPDEKVNLIEAPRPVYPTAAMKDSVTGTVMVTVQIGEDGQIVSARAESGPEALRAAAIEAAYKARFSPPKVNGKPAKANALLSYDFEMTKGDC